MKKVGTAMYVHKSNIDELLSKLTTSEKNRIKKIISDFDKEYAIIKYDKGKLSLIESNNWDTVNEPDVGNSYCFDSSAISSNVYKTIKASGKIYHNKWMFVSESYKGFDINKAKERTKLWNSIPDIKSHKSRIGNKSYWEKLLKDNSIEI